MKRFFILPLTVMALRTIAQTPVPPAAIQIKLATLAAPADKRDGATVMGYNTTNQLIELRKGTNEMICLADDPAQKGFSVSCYHRDLEPFMKRGRELKQEGKKPDEILKIRESEVKSGKWAMPKHPSSLFVYTAKEENVDLTTGEVKDGYQRGVVYIPYATAESTGLPTSPAAPGMPWIMDPGTHRAHIMVNPPAPQSK